MKSIVRKFTLSEKPEQLVLLPKYSEILTVDNNFNLWYKCESEYKDDTTQYQVHYIRLIKPDEEIVTDNMTYISSILQMPWCWHVFEEFK